MSISGSRTCIFHGAAAAAATAAAAEALMAESAGLSFDSAA